MSIADMVSRRLSRLSRHAENESGQKDPKNLLAATTVPTVPTDNTESREGLKTSAVDIRPVVDAAANHAGDTAFPVGTVGTVGTAERFSGKFCPDWPKPESGQSGQSRSEDWMPRGYGRCPACREFGWLPEGPEDGICDTCARLLADEAEVTLRGEAEP